MWRFKMCPRCEGDIFVDKDASTWYEKCLQCGYERELKSMVEREKQPVKVKRSEHRPREYNPTKEEENKKGI